MSSVALSLNLPPDARERLRSLAKAAKKSEAVYARELLVDAIARAERDAFRRRLVASRTHQRRARDRAIATALQHLHG